MTTSATETKTGAEAASSAASAASDTAAADAAAAAAAAAATATETKTADAGAAAETKTDPSAATSTVPETYDLKLPDGSGFDADFVKRTADNARALGLSNEAGQKYLEQQIAEVTKATAAALERGKADALAAMRKDWTPNTGPKWLEQNTAFESAALADPSIGGTPEKLAASVEKAKAVVRAFGDEEFAGDLEKTGWGSKPSVLRFLAKIGRGMSEDSLRLPGPRTGGMTEEEKLARRYPEHAKALAKANT